MRTTAIVVAAGEGRRIGGDVSKTYVPIAGRSLVLRTLDRIFSTPAINDVVLVIAPDDFERCEKSLAFERRRRQFRRSAEPQTSAWIVLTPVVL